MANEYYLGIDTSTTSSKALLIDRHGAVIGTASSAHKLSTPRPLWSEQDPLDWWSAVSKSIRDVFQKTGISGKEVKAVGLTGQMHGLVLLDEKGLILRPAILWNDQRTQVQCDEIMQRIGREKFLHVTGNLALTGFTAPKVLWVAENEPDVFKKIRHILLPKDYIRYRLTGAYAMDKADGSGTVLFDLDQRDWSHDVLSALGIDPEWLPDTYEGPETTGIVTPEAAGVTGLSSGTPVIAGAGDQAAGAIGVGAVEPGIVSLSLGTSGVIFVSTSTPLVEAEGRLHAFCHAVPGLWHLMGVMLSAAGSLQWYRDTLAPETPFDRLIGEAASIPAGSEGLQFLPYLSGERTPYPDPLARGAFIGLTLRHGRGHLTRAVLEGISFGLKDCYNLVRGTGSGTITQICASGGGTKNPVWLQILASILEVEVKTVNTTEGAAYGAALLAAVGTGRWPSVQAACRETILEKSSVSPDESQVSAYRKAYPIYQDLYPALRPAFTKMGE